jgi:Kef-type K+ transport system membrane component KefB
VGYGFLIPIFFFGVGMQTDPMVLLNAGSISKIIIILLLIILLKIAIGLVVLNQLMDISLKDKVVTTLVFTTVSESLGFAILNLANNAGVIKTDTYAIFAFILVSIQLLVIIIVELVNRYVVQNKVEQNSTEGQ